MSARPRATVVSVRPSYRRLTGAGEYLAGVVGCLGVIGFETETLFIGSPPWGALRQRLAPGYLAAQDRCAVFGARRLGGWDWVADLGMLGRAAGQRLRRRPVGAGLSFPPPEPRALDWAARRAEGSALVMANYFDAAAVFDRLPPTTPRALLAHDALALRRASFLAAGQPPDVDAALLPAEAAAWARADLLIAIKPEEAAAMRAVAPDAIIVVIPPLRAPAPDARVLAPRRRPAACVFVGGDQPPNQEALRRLLGEVWPRVRARLPAAELDVIGAVGACVADPWPAGARRLGRVEDLDAAYADACAALTPVRFGSGVKVKLVEGLCAGLPVVATRTGAEGVQDAPAFALTTLDDDAPAESMAAAIMAALARGADPATRRATRDWAASRFAPAAAADHLGAAIKAATARAAARATSGGRG